MKHHALILTALKAIQPANIEQIAEHTGLERKQVCKRMKELEGGNKRCIKPIVINLGKFSTGSVTGYSCNLYELKTKK
jgi:DNA-binding Lrp family transcriptional regulator